MNSRSKCLATTGVASCLILVGTCWVSAQQGRPRETYQPQATPRTERTRTEYRGETRVETFGQPTFQSTTPMLGRRASAVIGTCVQLSDGELVGRVDDLMINEMGCVDYMVVSFNGSSGFGWRLAAIPWNVGRMDFAARMVTLDVDRETLRAAPIFFSRGAWPNLYEPQWAANVHSYFGIESDIHQRIERAYQTPESKEAEPRGKKDQPRRDLQPRDEGLRPTPEAAPRPSQSPDQRPELRREGEGTFDEGRSTEGKSSLERNKDQKTEQDKESEIPKKPE